MIYGRVRGGRSWHLVSAASAVTMCGWRQVAEFRSLPTGRLCAKCYAIREEMGKR